jgi:hypothetical protein
MTLLKDPKNLLILLLAVLLLSFAFIITRHYYADARNQQKIYNHSDILDII